MPFLCHSWMVSRGTSSCAATSSVVKRRSDSAPAAAGFRHVYRSDLGRWAVRVWAGPQCCHCSISAKDCTRSALCPRQVLACVRRYQRRVLGSSAPGGWDSSLIVSSARPHRDHGLYRALSGSVARQLASGLFPSADSVGVEGPPCRASPSAISSSVRWASRARHESAAPARCVGQPWGACRRTLGQCCRDPWRSGAGRFHPR